jgi:UDP-3-O-[3-hydroxymyristoyl] glucosamine N-acyltransferase
MVADPSFFYNFGPFTLAEIAKISQAEIYIPDNCNYDESMPIKGVGPLDAVGEDYISVLNNKKYLKILSESKASACFIEKKYINYAPKNMALFICENPYKAYALTASTFHPEEVIEASISKTAYVSESAEIGENTYIDHNVVIAENVVIGNNCYIGANSVISSGVIIGHNSKINASVTISHAIIGDDSIIHPGVRIGQDGFGFASDRNGHYKVPQLGRVIIGNKVEIGANTCIDRGSGHDTIIGDSCMIDNLVQIGHNVELGKACVIVSQAGISGSTKLGDFVIVGGQVGMAGHLKIGSGAQIAAQSGVIKDVKPMEIQGGYPAVPVKQWHRQTIALKKLIKIQSEHNE